MHDTLSPSSPPPGPPLQMVASLSLLSASAHQPIPCTLPIPLLCRKNSLLEHASFTSGLNPLPPRPPPRFFPVLSTYACAQLHPSPPPLPPLPPRTSPALPQSTFLGAPDQGLAVLQLVPFPFDLVQRELRRYPNAEFMWCQEEPMNMGGYTHVCPRLETCMRNEDREVKLLCLGCNVI